MTATDIAADELVQESLARRLNAQIKRNLELAAECRRLRRENERLRLRAATAEREALRGIAAI